VSSDRSNIARQTAAALRRLESTISDSPVMIGFDGFVDSIIKVVNKRHDTDHFQPVTTIEAFGRKIVDAAGKSCNYELVTTMRKLGGNGPIMANAMAAAGFAVTYIGSVGRPSLDPVFSPLAERATVHGVADPGTTDALEFDDGKLMLGKYNHLIGLGIEQVLQVLGEKAFAQIVADSRLLAMVNWSMFDRLETIWCHLIERVLPNLNNSAAGRRFIFIDLSDPEKRTDEDLRGALQRCTELGQYANVVLDMNLKESIRVAAVDVDIADHPPSAIEQTAGAIRKKLNLHGVVIHRRSIAAVSMRSNDAPDAPVHTASFDGPFVAKPILSTGGGDNFNAGFCLGLLVGLNVEQCLCAATATSGYYVRHGRSPSLEKLIQFTENLPTPEANTK
jgi:sugar/nucleoside kinase (ribokinase family)